MHQHRPRVACACQEHTLGIPHTSKCTNSCVITPDAKCFAPTHNHIPSSAPEHDKMVAHGERKHRVWPSNTSSVATEDSSQCARLMRGCLQCPVALTTSLSFLHSTHRKITQEHTTHSTTASRHRCALAWPRNRASITRARDKGSKPHTAAQNTHTHPHTPFAGGHTQPHTPSTLLSQIPHSDSLISLFSLSLHRMLLERIVERAKSQISQVLVLSHRSRLPSPRVSSPLPFRSR